MDSKVVQIRKILQCTGTVRTKNYTSEGPCVGISAAPHILHVFFADFLFWTPGALPCKRRKSPNCQIFTSQNSRKNACPAMQPVYSFVLQIFSSWEEAIKKTIAPYLRFGTVIPDLLTSFSLRQVTRDTVPSNSHFACGYSKKFCHLRNTVKEPTEINKKILSNSEQKQPTNTSFDIATSFEIKTTDIQIHQLDTKLHAVSTNYMLVLVPLLGELLHLICNKISTDQNMF
jgi:hypothetical protein